MHTFLQWTVNDSHVSKNKVSSLLQCRLWTAKRKKSNPKHCKRTTKRETLGHSLAK